MRFSLLLLVSALFTPQAAHTLEERCGVPNIRDQSNESAIMIEMTSVKHLSPHFFGFNLEVVEFERSLWDRKRRRVYPEITKYLRQFPGAVYRYPGGTVSNYFDWQSAVGEPEGRIRQQLVDWIPPEPVQFGLDEYLSFVSDVGGTAWYVANLHGNRSSKASITELGAQALRLTQYIQAKASAGLPQVLRWELGNELDRGRFQYKDIDYVLRARAVGKSLSQNMPLIPHVASTRDWGHIGVSSSGSDYNAVLAKQLKGTINEFAGHTYYDGKPWGPPLPRVLGQLCRNIETIQREVPDATFWITEHARTPVGTPDSPNWKDNWWQSSDFGAALSVADLMISLAKTHRVNGAFVHSLHGGKGPWPMFIRGSDGYLRPTSVFSALLILREALLSEVLSTSVYSQRDENDSGYSINAVAMTNSNRNRLVTWLVNRSAKPSKVMFRANELASKKLSLRIAEFGAVSSTPVGDAQSHLSTTRHQDVVLHTSPSGDFNLTISPRTIAVIDVDM